MAENVPGQESKPKRKRTRRNYAKEIENLRTYAQVTIDVLEAQEPLTEYGKGKVAFAREILKRTEG